MQQNLQNKKGLVENVFNQVYNKYDLMNDFMSMGVHRYWKKSLINMMSPRVSRKLIDVACGTGDVGKFFLDSTNKEAEITCVDPNKGMVSQGKQKLYNYKKYFVKAEGRGIKFKKRDIKFDTEFVNETEYQIRFFLL